MGLVPCVVPSGMSPSDRKVATSDRERAEDRCLRLLVFIE
jgi:hypothetical protein